MRGQQTARYEPEAQRFWYDATFLFDGKMKRAKAGQWAIWINGRRHMPILMDDVDFRSVYKMV